MRQYERLGLVTPSRVGAKNRLYSDEDIRRIKQIQRLTQEMGVNLAGVEVILRLLEDMDDMRRDMDQQLGEYMKEVEQKLNAANGRESSREGITEQDTARIPRCHARGRRDQG